MPEISRLTTECGHIDEQDNLALVLGQIREFPFQCFHLKVIQGNAGIGRMAGDVLAFAPTGCLVNQLWA
jgi:hypothetical protein